MTANEHHQLDAACAQLERAILLFLYDHDYYSAATLAGAAEEIFGLMAEHHGRVSAFSRLHQRTQESLSHKELEAIRDPDDFRRKKDGVRPELYSIRNWLKHYSGVDDEIRYANMEDEAFDLIDRAVENRLLLLSEVTPSIDQFQEYARNRYAKSSA